MWQIVERESSGQWNELGSYDSLRDCKSNAASFAKHEDDIFYFWKGAFPKDEKESIGLFQEVAEANKGRVSRLTIGLDLSTSKKVDALTGCSGQCFCVIANGSRVCEAHYCNTNGYCWCVLCNSGC